MFSEDIASIETFGYGTPSICIKYLLTSILSNIATLNCFGGLAELSRWVFSCAANKYRSTLIFDADPTSRWYSLPLLTGFLSITHESRDKVKAGFFDSLHLCCCSGDGTRLGIYRYLSIIVTLTALTPNFV